MNIPIITLEVQAMRHTVKSALLLHAAQMDKDIQAAVDAYCTPENIGQVVRETARAEINEAVKEEVRNFFRYSPNGRKAIREAVHEHMERVYGEKDNGN